MNILQEIESKRIQIIADKAVDEELKGYTVEAIKLRIQKDKRNRKIAHYLFTALTILTPFVCLSFFISYSVWLAVLMSLAVPLLCSCSMRNIENKIEALESGLKRKIENNNKGESP